MGWEAYRKKRVVRHDFGEQGCGEFWVDLLSMDGLPYGESKKFRNLDMASEQGMRESEKILAGHIVNWSLTDPETGEPLPVPTKKDPSPLDKLPSEFILLMFRWMGEDSKAAQLVPQETGTFSGRL